jgi:hypothetical protein
MEGLRPRARQSPRKRRGRRMPPPVASGPEALRATGRGGAEGWRLPRTRVWRPSGLPEEAGLKDAASRGLRSGGTPGPRKRRGRRMAPPADSGPEAVRAPGRGGAEGCRLPGSQVRRPSWPQEARPRAEVQCRQISRVSRFRAVPASGPADDLAPGVKRPGGRGPRAVVSVCRKGWGPGPEGRQGGGAGPFRRAGA